MRQLTPFLVLLMWAPGCKKQAPVEATGPAAAQAQALAPHEQVIRALRTSKGEALIVAINDGAAQVPTDPALVAALLELLKDPSTFGPGRTHPSQVTSMREAAALTLIFAGPVGKKALQDKGLELLRAGLSDPSAAIQEHSVHTLGRLGKLSKPFSADMQKLVGSSDEHVRGAAADAVRDVGVTDVTGLAKLLASTDPGVRRAAAELLTTVNEVPEPAITFIAAALTDEDSTVRKAAARALSRAGAKGGSATAQKLAAAINATYPAQNDPTVPWDNARGGVFWNALVDIGPAAVPTLMKLFQHTNPLVRYMAAMSLGQLGADARPAAALLKKRLDDPKEDAGVLIEAACALCRIGAHTEDAVLLMKKALNSPVAPMALAVIPRMGKAGLPLVPAAMKKLTSTDPNSRYYAVLFVGQLDAATAKKAVADLAKLAADPEPDIRFAVGQVLEKLGPDASPAAEALAEALEKEQDTLAQEQFIEALIAMGSGAKPATTILLKLFNDPNLATTLRPRVLIAAAVADPTSADGARIAIKATQERNEAVRVAAAKALGTLDPISADALAALVKLANADSLLTVRVAALRALAEAGPKARAARAAIDSLTTNMTPAVALWARVAQAAIDGNVKKAAVDIREALTQRSAQARAAAAEALLLVGPNADDLPALQLMLKEGVGKEAAARALGKLGPAARNAVPRLILLLDDRDSAVGAAAAQALGAIGPDAAAAIPKLEAALSDPSVAPSARKALSRLGVTAKPRRN